MLPLKSFSGHETSWEACFPRRKGRVAQPMWAPESIRARLAQGPCPPYPLAHNFLETQCQPPLVSGDRQRTDRHPSPGQRPGYHPARALGFPCGVFDFPTGALYVLGGAVVFPLPASLGTVSQRSGKRQSRDSRGVDRARLLGAVTQEHRRPRRTGFLEVIVAGVLTLRYER